MALSAVRTHILPGFTNNGRRRVTVHGNKYVQVVIPVPESESDEEMHLEALRCALVLFPDGWAGEYVGGAVDGPLGADYVWVRHKEPETPVLRRHTSLNLLEKQPGINLYDWKGNSA